MNKISNFINRHVVLVVSFFIYVCCYVLLNSRGPLVDNDTIEYVGFAKALTEGSFPTSPYYQPGVGVLIFIFKKLFFTDYLTAFRLLNFTAGFGLVLVLQRLFKLAFNSHKYILISIAAMPVIVYLSSLLYADIVFDFFAFLNLLYLVKSFKDGIDQKPIWQASILTALSVFMKYNGLAVWVTGMVFIGIRGWINKQFIKNIFSYGVIYSLFPIGYVIFWRIFNGNLAMVQFNQWIEPVTFDCIIVYLKQNWVSSYHLFLDRGMLNLASMMNHYIILAAILVIVMAIFKVLKINIEVIKSKILNSAFIILLLFSFIYLFAVNTMEGLNCRTEPCVRLYSCTFIGLGILLMGLFAVFSNRFNKTIWPLFIYVGMGVYLISIHWRNHNETEGIVINKNNSSYISAIQFLQHENTKGIVYGFGTPKINRYWWSLGGDFNALGVFHYQQHHSMGHNYVYDDTTYLNMIVKHGQSMKPSEYLVVELEKSFISHEIPKIKNLKTVFKQDNVYVFQK